MRYRIGCIIIAAIAFCGQAFGQSSILQGGAWTPGRAPMYTGPGSSTPVVQDSGPASGGALGLGLAEQLLTVRNPANIYPAANMGSGPFGTNWCDYDAPATNPTGYHVLCLGPNSNGGGMIYYNAGGGASTLPFTLNVNGTSYQFPFVIGGIVGPGTTVIGDLVCWNNTVGTLVKTCAPITTAQIANGAVTSAQIAAGAVGSTQIAAATVANSNLANMAAGTTKCNPTGSPAPPQDCPPSAVNVTAPGVAYTPPGTGGTTTTAAVEFNRTIWANDYGAVCNGVTDDHVAFQNAINQGQATGFPVRFTGICAISTGLTITDALDFGSPGGSIYGAQGRLVVTNSAITAITVNTPSPVYLHDLAIEATVVMTCCNPAINVTATTENGGSHFERLLLNGNLSEGIDFARASTWTLSNSIINATNVAVRVQNNNNVDSGDSTIYGNFLQSTNYGVLWQSSGGLRIENNKILGSNMTAGIAFQLSSGIGSTSDLFVIGNSIEGVSTAGSGIALSRLGSTNTLSHIIIQGNEIGSGVACVNAPADANGVWINVFLIQGNSCITTNPTTVFGFIVNSTTTVSVTNNALYNGGAAASATPSNIGAGTATNCVVGFNVKLGT